MLKMFVLKLVICCLIFLATKMVLRATKNYFIFLLLCSTFFIYSKELPFVIVVSSYNNAEWVKKNLDSIFMQKYKNFRVIYVDDASQDGTVDLVEAYIQEHGLRNKITFIKNEQRTRKLKNIYNAYHLCKDHELIAQVDGDDWLAHPNVLALLNIIFSHEDVWFSYGQFMHSTGKMGFCSEIPFAEKQQGLFRQLPFVTTHLKVFYAWLFKMVKLQDLIVEAVPAWEGLYYPYANDCAVVYPMLDMARERVRFNKEVVYVFNRENPISGHVSQLVLQNACSQEVKALSVYPKLHKPVLQRLDPIKHATADCCILSSNPFCLSAALRSVKKYMNGLNRVIVWYQAMDQVDVAKYQELKEYFEDVTFYTLPQGTTQDLLTTLANSSKYIICMTDNIVLNSFLYCKKWIFELEKTFAYSCYGLLSCADFREYGIAYQHIKNDVYAWKFLCDKQQRINPNTFNLALYRKQDFIDELKEKTIRTVEEINEVWSSSCVDRRKVGLFFDLPSKAYNVLS